MSQLRLRLHAQHGPSFSRAAALSGAMTINLLVTGAMLLPAAIEQPQVGPRRAPDTLTVVERVVEIATAVAPPVPVKMPVAPLVVQPPIPVAVTPRLQPAVPSSSGPPVAIAASPAPVDSSTSATVPSTAAAAAAAADSDALAYINAPPPDYPKNATRNGWEGTVLLRVRVDTLGQPIGVEVLHSSGTALLTRPRDDKCWRSGASVPRCATGWLSRRSERCRSRSASGAAEDHAPGP